MVPHICVPGHADFDISSDPEGAGKFGGQYMLAPGEYDVYAITYGYTELSGEVRGKRHPGLELLANGQRPTDHLVNPRAGNPPFATDESVRRPLAIARHDGPNHLGL